MFLCIYLTPVTDCSVGTPSVMKLPLRVKSLCCEEMLAHVLGAIQLCPYGVLPVTVVPKFQQVCLILEHQHADEAILSKVDPCLLKALCTVFICTTQVRPSCDVVMSVCYVFVTCERSSPFLICFLISSDCIPSLCLSLMFSVDYLRIAAWFGVGGVELHFFGV